MSTSDDALAQYLDAHPDVKASVEEFVKRIGEVERLIGYRVYDETHIMRDDDLYSSVPAPSFAPSLDAVMQHGEDVPTFIDGHAATDAILALTQRRLDAEHAAREAQCKEWLTGEVRSRIAAHLEGHRGVVLRPDLRTSVAANAADAAVEVFLEFLREPPPIVEHADGTTEIREEER